MFDFLDDVEDGPVLRCWTDESVTVDAMEGCKLFGRVEGI